MHKNVMAIIAFGMLAGCSDSGVSVDATTALPGSWQCEDGIVLVLNADGSYEWHVPPGGGMFPEGDDKYVRTNPNGGYALLGKWRVTGGALELDMLGEKDRYRLVFGSTTAVTLKGPESYVCKKR